MEPIDRDPRSSPGLSPKFWASEDFEVRPPQWMDDPTVATELKQELRERGMVDAQSRVECLEIVEDCFGYEDNPSEPKSARNYYPKFGIAVCAKNEAHTIIETLDSLLVSVAAASEQGFIEYQMVVCINGSTDQTGQLVREWNASKGSDRCFVCELDFGNLVEAQREANKHLVANRCELYIFVDDDVIVDQRCVLELLTAMDDPKISACYCRGIPIKTRTTTFLQMALNQYDTNNTLFSERCHLHGRAFALRSWNIPKTHPMLRADDIYLSCALILHHGPSSIICSKKAIVRYHQIKTLVDYYQAFRRRNFEFRKCLNAFPEFKDLGKQQLNRQILWKQMLTLPSKEACVWIYFLLVRGLSFLLFSSEWHIFRARDPQWKATRGTKISFSKAPTE
jgi:glycosyltransferase involved in cell wall biosynthesis